MTLNLRINSTPPLPVHAQTVDTRPSPLSRRVGLGIYKAREEKTIYINEVLSLHSITCTCENRLVIKDGALRHYSVTERISVIECSEHRCSNE